LRPSTGQVPRIDSLPKGLLVRLAQLPPCHYGLLALKEPWLINSFAGSAAKAASNRTPFRTPKGVRFHRPNPSEGHGSVGHGFSHDLRAKASNKCHNALL